MMLDDGLLLTTGVSIVILSYVTIRRPDQKAFRKARLQELEEGAEEDFFEERRALEACPPRFHWGERTNRIAGFVGLFLGLAMIVWSIIQ